MLNDDSDLFSHHPNTTMRHELLSIREASKWASDLLKRDISESNITYLIQYGKIRRILSGSTVCVDKSDLMEYYNAYLGTKELKWKNRLGDDLNWHLSFDNLREKDTTKHVHRLHPYKGKFIPQ
ncbi:MAG: site-specific DNA-methyltransferase, partial [Alphaproteobacteria bacterium]|nr:site-specific DNA-methyltransferase [Alphaproteobacteria bacterium]